MPEIDPAGVSRAFTDFFSIGPVSWGLSVLVGGSAAAVMVRLIISALWR
jgi:hypothetical protein